MNGRPSTRLEDKGRVEGEGGALEVRKGTQKLHWAILVAVLWPYVLHFQASRVGFHRDLLGFILHHSHRSFCVLCCFLLAPRLAWSFGSSSLLLPS